MRPSNRKRPRPLALEPFDPAPSIAAGVKLLRNAKVPFALAGRLAVWTWVSPDDQEFTKDVDFAVPETKTSLLAKAARDAGYAIQALAIGGFAIRDGDTRIDFIDRRVDFGALFTEAVAVANQRKLFTTTSQGEHIPVTPADFLIAMKLATGDVRDERDVERLLNEDPSSYDAYRQVVRQHLGPAVANRLDHIAARLGIETAARYVRQSKG